MPVGNVLSTVPGILWPALPGPHGAKMLSVQYQLEQSQWLAADKLKAVQLLQLYQVAHHAATSVPYYQSLFAEQKITIRQENMEEVWAAIPLLTRTTIQEQGKRLISKNIPASHGSLHKIQTSGSTGRPITTFGTAITSFMWLSLTLRDHLWHKRDLSRMFAAIRPEGNLEPGKGVSRQGWGPATDAVFATGPSAALSVRTSVADQAAWLQKQDPAYLLSLPSNVAALAEYFLSSQETLPNLKEVRTYGEIVGANVRQLCRQAWNVPVVDMYTSQEVGYIALQCPGHKHYHIQSENLLVEILDGDDKPVAPGGTGRIVLTTLHNFAMPLIRYVVGDYAELGESCPCGRGLPVLNKIMGRKRNMLLLPDGRQHWPSFPADLWQEFSGIRQFQLIQKEKDFIMVRLVADRPLSGSAEDRLTSLLRDRFGYPFVIQYEYVNIIERSKGGKFEDFISEVVP